ncbi:MAG: AEC family transporter [Pseudomonadales bacterium]|nr:AEC family transporter [Pseudomonadales bacterium]
MFSLDVFYTGLLSIILMVLVGIILGKTKLWPQNINRTVSNILLTVAMPCALFMAFPQSFDQDLLALFLQSLGFSVLAFAIIITVSRLILSKKLVKKSHNIHQFAFVFNNASFIGFPLVLTTFGPEGLIPYAGLMFVFSILLFSYGVFLIEKKFSPKHIITIILNPNIIAVTLGLLVFLFSVQLPEFSNNAIRHLGSMTTPLSLLLIGAILSQANWLKLLKKKQLFITCTLQLLLVPTIMFVILTLLGAPLLIRQVLVIIQALPTATSLALFAEKYKDDVVEASSLVFISTILSVITLPLIVFLYFR